MYMFQWEKANNKEKLSLRQTIQQTITIVNSIRHQRMHKQFSRLNWQKIPYSANITQIKVWCATNFVNISDHTELLVKPTTQVLGYLAGGNKMITDSKGLDTKLS